MDIGAVQTDAFCGFTVVTLGVVEGIPQNLPLEPGHRLVELVAGDLGVFPADFKVGGTPISAPRFQGGWHPDLPEYLIKKHVKWPKSSVRPWQTSESHHTCSVTAARWRSLHSGIDQTIIALWLGHESVQSTQCYLHADLELKQRALEKTAPLNLPLGRYQPDDSLLSVLEGLKIMPSQTKRTPPSIGIGGL